MTSEHHPQASGYEEKDVEVKKIFFYGLAGILTLIILLVLMNEIFIASADNQVYQSVLAPESPELREVRAQEMESLQGYRVIDEQQGVYQVPIERAMELMADEAFQKRVETTLQ
jgi:hypothetical protein